ncbi:MAG: hypothetical protein KIT87_10850 [Anaerolineae bacterium]|nr:hypothetical protein [Anaerolineae bacterium]
MQLVTRLCLIAFSGALGIAVAYRLTPEAMAVVVGVLMGVLASLPIALIVIYAMRRPVQPRDEDAPAHPEPPVAHPMPYPAHGLPHGAQAPQIVVVPMPQAAMPRQMAGMWPQATMPSPAPRDFHIIGEDE